MSSSSKIILKKSSVQDKVPQVSDLEFGELALNFADGRIYYKDSSDDIRFFEETNSFQTIDVSGQPTLTAEGGSDTLTFVEGSGITITTDSNNNEITIESLAGTNDFVDSASFDTNNGELTLTRTDSGTVTVDLDGRYLESESDTLDSVTSRGSSTNNDISTGKVTSSGVVESAGLFVNSANINISYTVESGTNAMSAGPISVEEGSVITVEEEARWVII